MLQATVTEQKVAIVDLELAQAVRVDRPATLRLQSQGVGALAALEVMSSGDVRILNTVSFDPGDYVFRAAPAAPVEDLEITDAYPRGRLKLEDFAGSPRISIRPDREDGADFDLTPEAAILMRDWLSAWIASHSTEA